MNYPSTSLIKEAFLAVAEAEYRLNEIKKTLVNLHYKSEEVENSAFLLEHSKTAIAPSDDAGEVLFLRHQKAQADLTEAFQSHGVTAVEGEMAEAIKLVQKAGNRLHS